ncbi:MAG: glycosyltransferase family 39 protein [Blastocatellales bacterium]
MKSSLISSLQSAIRNPQSAIALVFIAMLLVSWRRWTSPIADSGREMDLPLRLLNGELLYRDAHYIYPPFSPYFNSALYRIFGAHLDVLQASGIVCAVLIAFLCYRIARRLLGPAESALATVAVVLLCVFKPAGNLISPYAYAALHGMIFALGALLLTLRYAETGRRRELIAAGVLIGLAAITKQEFALAGAITVAAAVAHLHRTNFKKLAADLSFAAAPALLIALPVYAALLKFIGWKIIVEDCHLFYTHLPASLVFYNSHRTGFDRPLFSLMQMAGAAAAGIAAMSGVVLLGDRTRKIFRWVGAAFVLSLIAVFAIRWLAGKQWDGSPVRALPLLLIAILIVEWRRKNREQGSEPGSPALFIVAAYSVAILARVALRVPSGGAFGGFFLPTSLILFCWLFTRGLPTLVERWTGQELSNLSGRRLRIVAFGLLAVTLFATAIVYGARYRKNFSYEIVAERGRLFAPKGSGQAIDEALRFIESSTRPGESIAVFPEGSDLAFLTGRRMPLRHQILIPGLMSEEDERTAIEKLRREPIRYVFVVNRPMREFGAEAFGRDFYTKLGAWVDEHYRLVKVCGASRDERLQIGAPVFFIKIFESGSGGR